MFARNTFTIHFVLVILWHCSFNIGLLNDFIALCCIEGYGIVFEQIYQDLVYILISIINNTMFLQLSKDTLPDSASHLGDYD